MNEQFVLDDAAKEMLRNSIQAAPVKTTGEELIEAGVYYIRAGVSGENGDLLKVIRESFSEFTINVKQQTVPLFKDPATGDTSTRTGKTGKGSVNEAIQANGGIKSRLINPDRADFQAQVAKYREEEIKEHLLTVENSSEGEEKEFVTKYLAENQLGAT